MKPAPFRYHAPQSRDELLRLLAELEDARMLAGGQSLVPLLNLRLAGPANLIDLNTVPGLDEIGMEGDTLRIGAMVRQRTAERSAIVRSHCPLLAEALAHVGHRQTRNRGTVGGSLAHMDPTAELPVVAAALDAVICLESARGARSLPFAEWPTGYLSTQIAPDEALIRVEFPCRPPGHGSAFAEVTRRGEGYAVVSVAALVVCDAAGTISRVAIAIGGLGAKPVRASAAEEILTGRVGTEAVIAAALAGIGLMPAEGDAVSPADYKQHLAAVLTRRTLQTAIQRAGSATHH